MADPFLKVVLRQIIAKILFYHTRYDRFQASTLAALGDLFIDYLQQLALAAKFHANYAGRTRIEFHDVLMALENQGPESSVAALPNWCRAMNWRAGTRKYTEAMQGKLAWDARLAAIIPTSDSPSTTGDDMLTLEYADVTPDDLFVDLEFLDPSGDSMDLDQIAPSIAHQLNGGPQTSAHDEFELYDSDSEHTHVGSPSPSSHRTTSMLDTFQNYLHEQAGLADQHYIPSFMPELPLSALPEDFRLRHSRSASPSLIVPASTDGPKPPLSSAPATTAAEETTSILPPSLDARPVPEDSSLDEASALMALVDQPVVPLGPGEDNLYNRPRLPAPNKLDTLLQDVQTVTSRSQATSLLPARSPPAFLSTPNMNRTPSSSLGGSSEPSAIGSANHQHLDDLFSQIMRLESPGSSKKSGRRHPSGGAGLPTTQPTPSGLSFTADTHAPSSALSAPTSVSQAESTLIPSASLFNYPNQIVHPAVQLGSTPCTIPSLLKQLVPRSRGLSIVPSRKPSTHLQLPTYPPVDSNGSISSAGLMHNGGTGGGGHNSRGSIGGGVAHNALGLGSGGQHTPIAIPTSVFSHPSSGAGGSGTPPHLGLGSGSATPSMRSSASGKPPKLKLMGRPPTPLADYSSATGLGMGNSPNVESTSSTTSAAPSSRAISIPSSMFRPGTPQRHPPSSPLHIVLNADGSSSAMSPTAAGATFHSTAASSPPQPTSLTSSMLGRRDSSSSTPTIRIRHQSPAPPTGGVSGRLDDHRSPSPLPSTPSTPATAGPPKIKIKFSNLKLKAPAPPSSSASAGASPAYDRFGDSRRSASGNGLRGDGHNVSVPGRTNGGHAEGRKLSTSSSSSASLALGHNSHSDNRAPPSPLPAPYPSSTSSLKHPATDSSNGYRGSGGTSPATHSRTSSSSSASSHPKKRRKSSLAGSSPAPFSSSKPPPHHPSHPQPYPSPGGNPSMSPHMPPPPPLAPTTTHPSPYPNSHSHSHSHSLSHPHPVSSRPLPLPLGFRNEPPANLNQEDITRCVCATPYLDDSSFMISCDKCKQWFHGRCVGILPGSVPESWFCPRCVSRLKKR
ncbi:hypothetical protein H4R33_001259 [Dimargaris cristalligena]|nr:hypothetical protein H4R33_001259 [Dimargaris cristalligena]